MSSLLTLGLSSTLRPAKALQARKDILNSYYEEGFIYSKALLGHSSCVNALEFSCGEGHYLASAGDDRVVRLWNLHREETAVTSAYLGPTGNIFSLAFSASNKYLYSGGVDCKVFRYALGEARATADTVWTHHDADVRAVAAHPYMDDVLLSCGEDGRVILYDSRANFSRAQATLQLMSEVTCVQYNPRMDHVFATSDVEGKNGVVHTARLTFRLNAFNSDLTRKFATTLQKPTGVHTKPPVSTVVFDTEGSKLCVTSQHFYPTIYAVTDIAPLAICTGELFPDGNPPPEGERTYCNNATIKHGSFGGPDNAYYAAGSDDFRGYVWHVPPLRELQERREVINEEEWRTREVTLVADSAFTDSRGDREARYLPVQLNRPEFLLRGHQSIVNTALIHPHLPLIATAGIESRVMLHSPTAGTPFSHDPLGLTRLDTRRLLPASPEDRAAIRRVLLGIVAPPEDEDGSSDGATMQLFDEILRTMSGDDNDGTFDPGLSWTSDESDSDLDEDEDVMMDQG